MTYFLAGVIALIVFSGALNAFLSTNPKWLSTQLRRVGGVAGFGFGLFLLTRGQWELAVPVMMAAAMLMGLMPQQWGLGGFGQAGKPKQRQTSAVRSTFLEMELDLDSGRMSGRFIAGPLAGQTLETLSIERLILAFAEIDGESASLLEAYLDRRQPGWREHAQGNPSARGGQTPGSGAMSEQEAYEILGLQPGASEEAIRSAHRTLMKKLHPDQGGSTWLATRINQAKDVLLGSHRRNS